MPITRYARPRLRLQSDTWLISVWCRLIGIVRDPRIFRSSLFPAPIIENRNRRNIQSLRAPDHTDPARARLGTDELSLRSDRLEKVCRNTGTILR